MATAIGTTTAIAHTRTRTNVYRTCQQMTIAQTT